MNDRYLYRAKRKKWELFPEVQQWVQGYYVHTAESDYIVSPYEHTTLFGEGETVEIEVNTLCQCTGLRDKNGKLIWENDIVDFLGHKGRVKYECGSFGIAYRECIDWEEIESHICPVTGCDNALCACENDNFISLWEIYWNFNDEDDCLSTIEVIGNIFDNPELLEVGE